MKENLLACPMVTKCDTVDLSKQLDFIQDNERLAIAKKLLSKVELCEFRYRVRKGLVVRGFIAAPKNYEKMPCIVHLRGGSSDFGKIDAQQLLWQVIAYAADGYVVITTQYPGVDGGDGKDTFGGPDDIASIKKLKDVLKCVSIADTSRIGVKGHSRGGLMTYMLLREVSWVRAAVIASAPTDAIRATKERKGWRKHQINMFGKSRAELVRRSPILWANELPKKTPLLLMHGSADWRVNASHSIQMSQKLFDSKIPHRFVLFEGADHAITEHRGEYHDMTRAWFKRYLSPNATPPDLKPHGM